MKKWIVVITNSYTDPTRVYLTMPPCSARVYYDTIKKFDTRWELDAFLKSHCDPHELFSGVSVAQHCTIKEIYQAEEIKFTKEYDEDSRPKKDLETDKKLRRFILEDIK